jgi:hypothetical protein
VTSDESGPGSLMSPSVPVLLSVELGASPATPAGASYPEPAILTLATLRVIFDFFRVRLRTG